MHRLPASEPTATDVFILSDAPARDCPRARIWRARRRQARVCRRRSSSTTAARRGLRRPPRVSTARVGGVEVW